MLGEEYQKVRSIMLLMCL